MRAISSSRGLSGTGASGTRSSRQRTPSTSTSRITQSALRTARSAGCASPTRSVMSRRTCTSTPEDFPLLSRSATLDNWSPIDHSPRDRVPQGRGRHDPESFAPPFARLFQADYGSLSCLGTPRRRRRPRHVRPSRGRSRESPEHATCRPTQAAGITVSGGRHDLAARPEGHRLSRNLAVSEVSADVPGRVHRRTQARQWARLPGDVATRPQPRGAARPARGRPAGVRTSGRADGMPVPRGVRACPRAPGPLRDAVPGRWNAHRPTVPTRGGRAGTARAPLRMPRAAGRAPQPERRGPPRDRRPPQQEGGLALSAVLVTDPPGSSGCSRARDAPPGLPDGGTRARRHSETSTLTATSGWSSASTGLPENPPISATAASRRPEKVPRGRTAAASPLGHQRVLWPCRSSERPRARYPGRGPSKDRPRMRFTVRCDSQGAVEGCAMRRTQLGRARRATMSRQSTDLEEELEAEYEDEFEAEFEDEWEQEEEAFFPGLGGIASAIGGLLGEEEAEGEAEWETEAEEETEHEAEIEGEFEQEGELEDEAEEFFGRLRRAFGKAAPFLRTLAKTAGPLVATAVGGPAAGALARAVTSQLEGEMEEEVEGEFEEMATAPLMAGQTLGEYLAAQAAACESESDAEALAAVAAYVALSPRDRRDLEAFLPALLRGAAVITRLLHGNRRTRPAVRLMPGVVDGAARTILRRAAAGQPVGPVEVGRVLGAATSQVLGAGPARNAVMRRHARGLAQAHRRYRGYLGGWYGPGGRRRRVPHGFGPYERRLRYGGRRPGGRPGVRTIRRQPVRSRTMGAPARVGRPRPGLVRVVTPVRVPARNGRPARTVRVVSDVRVPRGAVPTGRPVSVAGARRPR